MAYNNSPYNFYFDFFNGLPTMSFPYQFQSPQHASPRRPRYVSVGNKDIRGEYNFQAYEGSGMGQYEEIQIGSVKSKYQNKRFSKPEMETIRKELDFGEAVRKTPKKMRNKTKSENANSRDDLTLDGIYPLPAKTQSPGPTDTFLKQFQGLFSQLSPVNCLTLIPEIQKLHINTPNKMHFVVKEIWDRAIAKPNLAAACSDVCAVLAPVSVRDQEHGCVSNFRKYLLNYCQKQYEEIFVDHKFESSNMFNSVMLEEKFQRRSLAAIGFICEIFKQQMLTAEILMHIANQLVKLQNDNSLECLCQLILKIGEFLKPQPNIYDLFAKLQAIVNDTENHKISSRIRVMLQDIIEENCELLLMKPDDTLEKWQGMANDFNLPQNDCLKPIKLYPTPMDDVLVKFRGLLAQLTTDNCRKIISEVQALNFSKPAHLQFIVRELWDNVLSVPSLTLACAEVCSSLASVTAQDYITGEVYYFRNILLTYSQRQYEALFSYMEQNPIFNEELLDGGELHNRPLTTVGFISQMFKRNMLTSNFIMTIANQLLKLSHDISLECLYELLTIVGEILEFHSDLNDFFAKLQTIVIDMNNDRITYRTRVLLQDIIEVRQKYWILWHYSDDHDSSQEIADNDKGETACGGGLANFVGGIALPEKEIKPLKSFVKPDYDSIWELPRSRNESVSIASVASENPEAAHFTRRFSETLQCTDESEFQYHGWQMPPDQSTSGTGKWSVKSSAKKRNKPRPKKAKAKKTDVMPPPECNTTKPGELGEGTGAEVALHRWKTNCAGKFRETKSKNHNLFAALLLDTSSGGHVCSSGAHSDLDDVNDDSS